MTDAGIIRTAIADAIDWRGIAETLSAVGGVGAEDAFVGALQAPVGRVVVVGGRAGRHTCHRVVGRTVVERIACFAGSAERRVGAGLTGGRAGVAGLSILIVACWTVRTAVAIDESVP